MARRANGSRSTRPRSQQQRWAKPVTDIGPGTIILRSNQSRVAAPKNLRQSMVLVLMHNSYGSLGLCLNNLLGPMKLCEVCVCSRKPHQPQTYVNPGEEWVCCSPLGDSVYDG